MIAGVSNPILSLESEISFWDVKIPYIFPDFLNSI
jgi:hypothetical protein